MQPTEATQTCTRCKQVKSLDDFGKNSRASNGKMSHCKECENARCRIRDAQPERKIYHRNMVRKRNQYWYVNRRKKTQPDRIAIQEPGYIYLMHMNGVYKIGKTTNVQFRHYCIQGFMPYPVDLIHSFPVECMSYEEWKLHKKYERWRMNGEWFQLSEFEVNEIKNM